MKIDVIFKVIKSGLEIKVISSGDDYDLFSNHKDKYYDEYHPQLKEGGFGLSTIKSLSKSYKYEYRDKHAIVTLVLEIKK